MPKGFTLIEAIIYIALLSLIMGGVLPAVYQVLRASGGVSGHNAIQDEGNFVLRKIDWALTGISSINTAGASLNVTKAGGADVSITKNGAAIKIQEAGNDLPITTSNILVSNLSFIPIPPAGSPIIGVTATFALALKSDPAKTFSFTITKYIRQ